MTPAKSIPTEYSHASPGAKSRGKSLAEMTVWEEKEADMPGVRFWVLRYCISVGSMYLS